MWRAWSALLLNCEQHELSTPEVRWQWYRAHPSVAVDLGRFPVALLGVAGSASVSGEKLQSVLEASWTARCCLFVCLLFVVWDTVECVCMFLHVLTWRREAAVPRNHPTPVL